MGLYCQTHKYNLYGGFLVMGSNSSHFKRGFDPRRVVHQGKGIQVFRDTLAEHMRNLSLDAVAYVQSVLNDEKAPQKLRVICAQEIMNRSWGTPVNTMIIKELDKNDDVDISKISTKELDLIVAKLAAQEGNIIEAEVVEVVTNTETNTETPKYSQADAKAALKQAGVSE